MKACGLICLLLLLGCAPRRPVPLPLLVLYNGDMEQGIDYPTRWGEPWVGYKQHAVSRDTTVKKAGKAALRITLTAAMGEKAIGQEVIVSGPRRLTLRGWLKTEGAIMATVALRPFRNGWEVLPYKPALQVHQETDWTPFEQTVTVPAEATRFEVGVLVKGTGKAWLDEVRLEGEQVENRPTPALWVAPPRHQEPTKPYPGFLLDAPEGWQFNHQEQKKYLATTKPKVLLVGDSITQGWAAGGGDAWTRDWKPLGTELMALGGDRTSQVLWRLQDGTLAGLHPQVVVLLVGINNLLRDTNTDTEVADGVLACRAALQKACPTAQVLVIGLFPAKERAADPLRARIRHVNALLKAKLPELLDLGDRFLEPDGTLRREISPDQVHFSSKGYALYHAALYPEVLRHLKGTRP